MPPLCPGGQGAPAGHGSVLAHNGFSPGRGPGLPVRFAGELPPYGHDPAGAGQVFQGHGTTEIGTDEDHPVGVRRLQVGCGSEGIAEPGQQNGRGGSGSGHGAGAVGAAEHHPAAPNPSGGVLPGKGAAMEGGDGQAVFLLAEQNRALLWDLRVLRLRDLGVLRILRKSGEPSPAPSVPTATSPCAPCG